MKNNTLLLVLIWLLVLMATTTGTFYKTWGSPINFITVRGEHATYQGSGLYRYDPASVAREGVIWDVINLFVGLPLFAIAILLSRRASLRGHLLLAGLLFYFFYVYLMYATMIAFNPMFMVYVAIFALSAVAFFLNLQQIDVCRLPEKVSSRFPRRLFIGYTFVLSAMLVLLWGRLIVSITITGRFPPELAGLTTLQTQALDLGLLVPLLLSTGILLWRRSAWGYLLTGVSLTHGFMMFIAIPTWIAVPLIREGKIKLIEAAPFLGLCLVGFVLTGIFYRSVEEKNNADLVQ